MSQENVDIVRRVFALNEHEINASWEWMAPDFELDMSAANGPYQGVYGRAAAQRMLREFGASWEAFEQEALEFIDAGEQVVMPFVFRPQGRSGIEVSASGTYVFTLEDGLVTHIRLYQDRAEALEAVGLSE